MTKESKLWRQSQGRFLGCAKTKGRVQNILPVWRVWIQSH